MAGSMSRQSRGTPAFTGYKYLNRFSLSLDLLREAMPSAADKPLLRVLRGETIWPPPVWLMRQAGRYLPEYRAVRAQLDDFITLCTSPEYAAKVTLQPVKRFGFDAAILFSDILMLPWALGRGLSYREGEGPVLPPLRDAAAIASLDPTRLMVRVAPIMETVGRVAAVLAADHPNAALIGFAGGPFTVACYMIEGGGSKDFVATRLLAWRDPPLFIRLMDVLTETTETYLAAQIEAGADAVMLFDSWAGILPPSLFRAHVIAPTRRLRRRLRSRFPQVPIIGFPRLAGLMLEEYVATTEVDAVGIDTTADLGVIARVVPPRVVIQGNLDPVALLAGGASLVEATTQILTLMRGRPFVFNLGHGVLPETLPAHVMELVRLVRAA
jgi:uroporphyrinogen decarboxylase